MCTFALAPNEKSVLSDVDLLPQIHIIAERSREKSDGIWASEWSDNGACHISRQEVKLVSYRRW